MPLPPLWAWAFPACTSRLREVSPSRAVCAVVTSCLWAAVVRVWCCARYVYKSKAQRDLEAAEAADRETNSTIEEDIEKLVRHMCSSLAALSPLLFLGVCIICCVLRRGCGGCGCGGCGGCGGCAAAAYASVVDCCLSCVCGCVVGCVRQRAELPKAGLIPVTAETFAKWKADRAAKKIADWEAKRAEEAKRTGGRGLSTFPPSPPPTLTSPRWCFPV